MRTNEWKEGDVINPEYYDKYAIHLYCTRYAQRDESDGSDDSCIPCKPLPDPSITFGLGVINDKGLIYVLSQEHADAFNKYDIPKQFKKKSSIISVIGGLFK